jgi:divalent metal cation (Fe/Co/Zn/Cd) transporter
MAGCAQANRAVAVSAMGLALTGLIELVIAILSGSVALLGDALHNLSDVSTSALVFIGFRSSRKVPTERYSYDSSARKTLQGSVSPSSFGLAHSSQASRS